MRRCATDRGSGFQQDSRRVSSSCDVVENLSFMFNLSIRVLWFLFPQRGSTTQSSARHVTASKLSADAVRSQFLNRTSPIGVSAI